MATLASLNQKCKPEEIVRQKLYHHMIGPLGYPKEAICLEMPLKNLPHLSGGEVPDCRLDLVVFAKGIHPDYPLFPLLLIECKKEKMDQKVLNQLLGYNSYVGAPFIAIAYGDNIRFGWRDKDNYTYLEHLPPYQELLVALQKP